MTLLTPQEIADILKISYDKALDFIKYSGIPYIQIGRQYRIEESKLTAFLQKNQYINLDNTL
ncbi:MAG: helix-turn-helix domain-containing protein [Clostridia bacterium]|nr:helix-turn-helix domain-containing protein [Clostridia bacterium]